MHIERGADDELDYDAVRTYWEDAADEAESASYMAHDQGLPADCVAHRFALEQAIVDRWFAPLGASATVLDIGCGAGAWTALLARRHQRVVGVDASAGMLAAARRRLASHDNVELVHGNALTVPLRGDFDGVLVGGLLMYLDRADVDALLNRLRELTPNGRIILRESGVRAGVEIKTGEYPVAYRSVGEYEAIAADAGLRVVSVERNEGYAHMEIAITLTEMLRRLPPLARREAAVTGGPLWRFLRLTSPVTLGLLPRAVEAVGFDFPHLVNNFLLLEPEHEDRIDLEGAAVPTVDAAGVGQATLDESGLG